METLTVQWQKRRDYPVLGWCPLKSELLNDPRLEMRLGSGYAPRGMSIRITGVYLIWAGCRNRTILKVGSGIIKDRLRAHIRDPKVQAYASQGLYVTWAPLLFGDNPKEKQEGVEKFLGVRLNPKLVERLPNHVDFIRVNLPEWDPPVHPLLRVGHPKGHLPLNRPPIPFRNR